MRAFMFKKGGNSPTPELKKVPSSSALTKGATAKKDSGTPRDNQQAGEFSDNRDYLFASKAETKDKDELAELLHTIKEQAPNPPSEPSDDPNDVFFQKEKVPLSNDMLLWIELLKNKTSEKANIKITSKVDKEGWLTKEGRLVKSWKKRWFILSGSTLNYYTAHKNKLKGSINLESYAVRICKDRADNKECLELSSAAQATPATPPPAAAAKTPAKKPSKDDDDDEGEDRVLYCDAESGQERMDWFVALNNKIALLQYLKKTAKSDNAVLEFFSHNNATVLDMSRSLDTEPATLDAMMALKEPIRFHNMLKKIQLKYARIGDEGLNELGKALLENKTVEEVDLTGNVIGVNGMKHFVKVLMTNKTLKDLDFTLNTLDDEAMKQLCEGLAKCTSPLTRLCLNENQIGDAGASLFAETLLKNPEIKLKSLDLTKNQIGDQGSADLGTKLLVENKYPSLLNVELGYNKINNDGAKALADSLHKNTTLKVLNLEYNEIGYKGTKELAFMIVKNVHLEKLVLGGNRLGETALHLLANTSMQFPELVLVSMDK